MCEILKSFQTWQHMLGTHPHWHNCFSLWKVRLWNIISKVLHFVSVNRLKEVLLRKFVVHPVGSVSTFVQCRNLFFVIMCVGSYVSRIRSIQFQFKIHLLSVQCYRLSLMVKFNVVYSRINDHTRQSVKLGDKMHKNNASSYFNPSAKLIQQLCI